jgi:hypothetical protein
MLSRTQGALHVMDTPVSLAGPGICEPASFLTEQVAPRHAYVGQLDLTVAVLVLAPPRTGNNRWMSTPGMSVGTAAWTAGGGPQSILPITISSLYRGSVAPEMHHVRRLTTQSSPSRSMFVSLPTKCQLLHIARVRRLAVDGLGSELVAPAGQLRDRSVLEVGEPALEEEATQTSHARLSL